MNKISSHKQVEVLWQEYKERLKGYIHKRVHSEEEANNIAHEVLLKVYNSCCSDRDINNLRSWLFQIAHNTVVDHFRMANKLSSELPELEEETENQPYREAADLIEPLLGFLPEKYALPLRMSDIEGIPQRDIADKLELSLTAVKSQVQRARKLLKQEVMSCCHLETDSAGNLLAFGIKDSCKPLQEFARNKLTDNNG